jgi:hypothetical protein
VRWCREWRGGERPGREPAAALLTLAGLAALAGAGAAGAYLDAPPVAHTGGFGEPTCAACHRGAPLDDAGGSLTLTAPPEHAAGEEHFLEVRLTRAGMERAGFQLSARFAEGARAGRQAGTLTVLAAGSPHAGSPTAAPPTAVPPTDVPPTDVPPNAAPPNAAPPVQVLAAHDVAYAGHTAAGAAQIRGGEARWRVRWRAPAEAAGPVVFHLAANAGNFDDSELGDFVYLASAVSRPRSP